MNPSFKPRAYARDSVDARTNRREIVQAGCAAAIAAAGVSWSDVVRLHADEMRRQGMACILLWMAGGPSQLETFDPKPEHANGGETTAISTNVPGIQFADNLPQLAKVADRLAVIRSMTIKEGDHSRATHLMQTAHLPLASVRHPTLGAVASRELANGGSELPAFIRVGGSAMRSGGGGFLGSQYDAFFVHSPGSLPDYVRPATDEADFRHRVDFLARLQPFRDSAGPRPSDHQLLYAQTSRMILSPRMQAFELDREPAASRDRYGRTPFGAACLLARRLIEAGVTFVETSIPNLNWDTHDNNFARCRMLCQELDQPFAYLLTDLAQRGLLDTTLVIWMGEFGRTPRIAPDRAGRDHFPHAFSVALAGAGIRGGRTIGATDASGETIRDRPVTEKDLYQSIYKALRIDARKANTSPIGRPIQYVDGGQPIDELFA